MDFSQCSEMWDAKSPDILNSGQLLSSFLFSSVSKMPFVRRAVLYSSLLEKYFYLTKLYNREIKMSIERRKNIFFKQNEKST